MVKTTTRWRSTAWSSEDTEWARTMPHMRKSEALIKNRERDKENVANQDQKDAGYVNEHNEKADPQGAADPPAYFTFR